LIPSPHLISLLIRDSLVENVASLLALVLMFQYHDDTILVGNGVAATDVEHVVESAVALNIEAALLVASRFGRADTRWI
jgi:hypothetical protein